MAAPNWQQVKLRFMYLAIGLGLGLVITFFVRDSYNTLINHNERQYQERIAEYRETIASSTKHVSLLQEENTTLKKKVRIVEQTNADGSSSRTYEAASDSSRETRSLEQITETQHLRHTIELERLQHYKEVETLKKSRPSLHLSLGLGQDLTPYVAATYNVRGPFLIGGHGNSRGEFGFGLGLRF